MKAKRLSLVQEEEIAERIQVRIANSNKRLMAEYGCSRSLIDRISREIRVPCETKQNALNNGESHEAV